MKAPTDEEIKDLKVRTKQMPSGEWSCYTTYKGVDRAFTGDNILVQEKMQNYLKNEKINIIWDNAVIHPPPEPNYKFRLPHIDDDMV